MRVLVACRPTIPRPPETIGIEITPNADDLERVIRSRVRDSGKKAVMDLEEEIIEKLLGTEHET